MHSLVILLSSAFEWIEPLVPDLAFFYLVSLLIPILRTVGAASTRHDVMTLYYPPVVFIPSLGPLGPPPNQHFLLVRSNSSRVGKISL